LWYKNDRSFFFFSLRSPERTLMSPADIAAAELRAGLSRRLAELGLVPPDPTVIRLHGSAVPAAPAEDQRKAA
jgi:hypothetical protein